MSSIYYIENDDLRIFSLPYTFPYESDYDCGECPRCGVELDEGECPCCGLSGIYFDDDCGNDEDEDEDDYD